MAGILPRRMGMCLHATPAFSLSARRTFSSTPAILSHIGKQSLPYGSDVVITHDPTPIMTPRVAADLHSTTLKIKGPLGEHTLPIKPFVNLKFEKEQGDSLLSVTVQDSTLKEQRSMWGTTRALIANAITGVTEGYTVPVRLVGVGYRATVEPLTGNPSKKMLSMKLGYSHQVEVEIPEGIQCTAPLPNKIMLQGNDIQKVKEFAFKIRKWRPPEPYNQKGIFVGDETIAKKTSKKK
ncbi:large subunit ribosomal protein L6 [Entomortierella parvispora]|uniref:Large subunit ribosomal protein L6 n=1 Tax=Entomortierella parvispora TaxID=205924 RepID=A0A9P3HKN8_9FUNG|nr:large subunit ribosomal protein L6 [Entomortierella parvispora]